MEKRNYKMPKPARPGQPTMLSFGRDLPNLCSLAGLLCAVLGIYFAIRSSFHLAIIGVLWAVLFDWADGIIPAKLLVERITIEPMAHSLIRSSTS